MLLTFFLFFAEAMTHFLRARTIGIRGVRLPIRDDSKLLDSEYADDTALYVQDDEIVGEGEASPGGFLHGHRHKNQLKQIGHKPKGLILMGDVFGF